MRSALLSAVSHDLRTPLASITGAASTLRSQGDKLAESTREELLESISEEAERLGRLVSNLLDMTRFSIGQRRAASRTVSLWRKSSARRSCGWKRSWKAGRSPPISGRPCRR